MSNKNTSTATRDAPRPRTTHGLTAADPALTRAEKIRFNRFREAQLRCLDPRDATEAYLAERVVFHRWLLLKCDQAEAAALRDAVWTKEHPPTRLSDAVVPEVGDLIRSLHDSNRPPDGQPLDDHRTVTAFTSDLLQNIWRYRSEHERALDRAENRFLHYRKSRILIGLPTDHAPPEPPPPPRRRPTPRVTPPPRRTRSATPQQASKPRPFTKSHSPPRTTTSRSQTTCSHSPGVANSRNPPQSVPKSPGACRPLRWHGSAQRPRGAGGWHGSAQQTRGAGAWHGPRSRGHAASALSPLSGTGAPSRPCRIFDLRGAKVGTGAPSHPWRIFDLRAAKVRGP